MRHPLLDPVIVEAVEQAAAAHLGHAWARTGFTDLNHRASHPCGIFTGTTCSVFAKLDGSPDAAVRFAAELAGLHQVRGEAFGLAEFDGFFGPLPQGNQPSASGTWAGFYAERRLLPSLRIAVDSGFLPAGLARGTERTARR